MCMPFNRFCVVLWKNHKAHNILLSVESVQLVVCVCLWQKQRLVSWLSAACCFGIHPHVRFADSGPLIMMLSGESFWYMALNWLLLSRARLDFITSRCVSSCTIRLSLILLKCHRLYSCQKTSERLSAIETIDTLYTGIWRYIALNF